MEMQLRYKGENENGSIDYVYRLGYYLVRFTQDEEGEIKQVDVTMRSKKHEGKRLLPISVENIYACLGPKSVLFPHKAIIYRTAPISNKYEYDSWECREIAYAFNYAAQAIDVLNNFFADCEQRKYVLKQLQKYRNKEE